MRISLCGGNIFASLFRMFLRFGDAIFVRLGMLLLLVIEDVHKLLQDFLIFGVNTHIDLLIVLLKSLFLIPALENRYLA